MLERARQIRPAAVLAVIAFAAATVHTVLVARFAMGHSGFNGGGDDIGGFWAAKHLPFVEFLFSPIDVHRVPLQRLLTYVMVRMAPLNFVAADAVLLAFHIAGCVFLLAALRQIRKTPANYVLVAWCAINPYLASQLYWWTAGSARLPYILCSNAAAYFYLAHRATGSRIAFGAVLASAAIALGFFAKGVLIPAYLSGLELALRWKERTEQTVASAPRRAKGSHVAALLGILFAVALGYVVAWRSATPPELRSASSDLGFLVPYGKLNWLIFGLGTCGFLVDDAPTALGWVAGAWVLAFVCSILRARSSLVPWGAAFVLVSTSIYAGTSQARANSVGALAAIAGDRYYFELMPVLTLFAGVALAVAPAGALERSVLRSAAARWCGALALSATFVYVTSNSYASAMRLFDRSYTGFRKSRLYVDNVRSGIGRATRLADGAFPLVDSPIPFGFVHLVPHPRMNSELLELLHERPRIVWPRHGAYWITESGRLYRL